MFKILLSLLCFSLISCERTGKNEESEIRSKTHDYEKAFNRQDAKALAALWTEDGVYIEPRSGNTFEGREAIEKSYQARFDNEKNSTLHIKIDSVEFPSENEAIEKGTAILTESGKQPLESHFKVLFAKQNKEWLLDQVIEADLLKAPSHYEELKGLEWLIGKWVDKDDAGAVKSSYSWDAAKNFITQKFTVALDEKQDQDGIQIIGWDPVNKEIRSWLFDSDGGFGQGTWSQKERQWIVDMRFTLPDGRQASSVSILTPVDSSSFQWESTGREVGGEILPNLDPVTIIREKE